MIGNMLKTFKKLMRFLADEFEILAPPFFVYSIPSPKRMLFATLLTVFLSSSSSRESVLSLIKSAAPFNFSDTKIAALTTECVNISNLFDNFQCSFCLISPPYHRWGAFSQLSCSAETAQARLQETWTFSRSSRTASHHYSQ
uniref:Uncharacterized protein n=1 Tax=Glossina austeni TaxID=7395 RepID=A0A1A9URV3_GLOAU